MNCRPGCRSVHPFGAEALRRMLYRHSSALLLPALLFAGAGSLRAATPDQIVSPVEAARVQTLRNHHPLWAVPANDAGPVSEDLPLNQLTLVLARTPQQESAFQQLLADQQNPASPQYHHWLTPAQIGQRFGLSDHDLDTLRAWLESQGLRVTWVAPSHTFMGFAGTAAQVDQAFQTSLHRYRVQGQMRVSVDSDPAIPQALAPVIQGVRGLYSVADKPAHTARAEQADAPQLSISSNNYIAPADFAAIYDLPSSVTGTGTTIGIVGWSRVDPADLEAFRQRTGTSFADPVQLVPQGFGGTDPGSPYSTPQTCASCLEGQEEATLDVERAGSVAQGANLLLVVSSPSGANDGIGADAQYLIQTSPAPAQVVSISFGDCESDAGSSGVAYWNRLFQQAAAEGISVIVSSGDSGAAGCDQAFATPPSSPQQISPNYICSSPYATCVGGTDFNDSGNAGAYWASAESSPLGSAVGYIPEGAWNEPISDSSQPQAVGSGGGVSRYIATPSWQAGVTGVPAQNAGRYTPDVSFSSSCREGYFGCMAAGGGSCMSSGTSYQFEIFCGTSAAAPGMAGIAALLDQEMGGAPQGNLNPQLYRMQTAAPAALHDVTIASSGVTDCNLSTPSLCNNSLPSASGLGGGQTGYLVGTGFDEVTGLGSLDVQKFLSGYATFNGIVLGGAAPVPSFSISGSGLNLVRGTSSGNASTIRIQPSDGFTGTVTLTAQVASSPAGAQDPPTFTWSPASHVNITNGNPATITLTVTTTPPPSATLSASRQSDWHPAGGAALASLLLVVLPGRRRAWRSLLGVIALLAVFTMGATGCSSGIQKQDSAAGLGTTAGAYVITVTGTSGSLVKTGTIVVNVQ